MKAIDRKHHALIRSAIETRLSYEPDKESRNRKLLNPPAAFGARWELRMRQTPGERLYIGGKEVKI